MKVDTNLLGIFDGMWAVSPAAYYEYMALFATILSKNQDPTNFERTVSASINYVIDNKGEKIDSSQIPQESIGVVHLIGPMIKYGNWYFWGANELVSMLDAFDKNPNIIGTILKIDTGGGSVKAVAPFLDFFKRKTKPVVSLADTSASAGLWVQSGTDYSFAENNITAQFGSIGTMASFFSFKKYYEDLGIKELNINSSYSADKNKAFELALEEKFEEIRKEYLDPLALKFQSDIKQNLPKLDLNVDGMLTGKMFYAEKSLEYNLINAIGNEFDAIEKVKELAAVHTFMN